MTDTSGTHDSGGLVDLPPGVDQAKFAELLQAQTDRFMREETGKAIVEWVTRKLHYFANSGSGELTVTCTYVALSSRYVIDAIYRHQTGDGILLCTGRAVHDAERVAEAQDEVATWRELLNGVVSTIRTQLSVDLKRAGITELEQGGQGWYEAGKGYERGRAHIPPLPQRVDPDEEQHAIETVKKSVAALSGEIEKESDE